MSEPLEGATKSQTQKLVDVNTLRLPSLPPRRYRSALPFFSQFTQPSQQLSTEGILGEKDMNIATVIEVLESYHGRDKVLRLLTYLGKLTSGIASSKNVAIKSQIFSNQISGCRVMLRLLDDIPMLHHVVSYGLGKAEPDWVIRWANLLKNLLDVIFSPIEHICWAGECKILSVNVASLDLVTTWCWVISLYLSLVKSLRKVIQLEKQKVCLQQSESNIGLASRILDVQQRDESLSCLRLILDLSYAVNYLPSGVLWGGKLKTWHVGVFGTVSSLIVLYQMFSKRTVSKK
ncbi:peroxisomal membrane protein 11C isoform X4 [Neodiprion fabricii]|nr:peroxisomal membrane protein 11C isoform X4 [Neodiprion fabricii]XP_046436594.1 peroxisomal membrane protein 11C isoform X4 [Neodiprion fabricii]XP_046436595.1 peroxisomal membrane protein 11C isoform X4 [Neodiprion fabricii]